MNGPAHPNVAARPGTVILVAAHVVAVTLIYGVALWVGGGYAAPPFPPNVSPRPSASPAMRSVARVTVEEQVAPTLAADLPASNDLAPPWTHDGAGRTHFTER